MKNEKTNKGGRPKLTHGNKAASIIIHLTKDEKTMIVNKAGQLAMSTSEYSRNLVLDKLEKHPKFRMLPDVIRKELNELKKISGLLKLLVLKIKADNEMRKKFNEVENSIFDIVRNSEKIILHEIENPQYIFALENAIHKIEENLSFNIVEGRGELISLKMILIKLKTQHTTYYKM